MAIGVILGVISAATAIYSAAQQSESQRQAAKQSEYDAEFEAEQQRQAAEQERLNREAARKTRARESEEAKRRRISFLTRAGGGIGMSALQELSRQASLDEINIQNAEIISRQRRTGFGMAASNALLSGRSRAGALRAQSRATALRGAGSAVGSIAGGFQ